MKVISIVNYKGGVGKTTIAANMAVGLAARGRRTLVIDLDPQTNLTYCFIEPNVWQEKYSRHLTVRSWFDVTHAERSVASLAKYIIQDPRHMRVDVIAAHLGLIETEMTLAASQRTGQKPCNLAMRLTCHVTRLLGMCPKRSAMDKPLQAPESCFTWLKTALAQLVSRYDVVLIDCPPSFGVLTRCAIAASSQYIVPAKMDFLSTIGIDQLCLRVQGFASRMGQTPALLGVVANMVSYYGKSILGVQQDYVEQLRRRGVPVFDSMLRESKTAYAASEEFGVFTINKAGQEAATELDCLVEEFIERAGV